MKLSCIKKYKTVYQIFIISLLSMFLIMLPDMIINRGLFIYSSDYAYQQIPFYYHSSEYVKGLCIGWDWYTDLGADFLASYSFYLAGSIFFWMVSWLSGKTVIWSMAFMIAIKVSIAAVGAYVYIKRYVKNEKALFIGAYMYAFSGFQLANIIYNHFLDITALFPFLLFAFDRLVYEKKKGFFAFMVGLAAATNYFFFIGIVFFVIIYYIIKIIKKEFVFELKTFAVITFESLIGVLMAAVILLPSAILISSADRADDVLYGVDLLSYSDNTIIPKLLQSFFVLPDSLGTGTLFESAVNANGCSSQSLYLPLFSITGVVAYIKNKRDKWLSASLKIFFFIALIPCLNSIFTLFNESYYARWIFMPVLLMCLATAKSLEEKYDFRSGIKITASGLVVLALIACLPDKTSEQNNNYMQFLSATNEPENEVKWFSMSTIPSVLVQYLVFSVISTLLVYAYCCKRKNLRSIALALVLSSVVTSAVYINNTVELTYMDRESYLDSGINYKPELEAGTYRITHVNDPNPNNFGMIWGYMNAGCFHSIEPNESDDFYYNIKGQKRMMGSEYTSPDDYPSYGLLSIKYIFNKSTNDDLNVEIKPVKLKGCTLFDKQAGYYIYKNDHFVPFGFMYDYCISDDSLEKYLDENIDKNQKYHYKTLAMMRALVLDDKDVEQYKEYIKPLPVSMLEGLNEKTYYSDCDIRSMKACSSFDYDSKGYRAEITSERKGIVYFSVPCSSGWSAKVNGRKVEVIKAHYGLTAVAVEPGENRIEFSYETPGLAEGRFLTFISVSVFALYILVNQIINRKREKLYNQVNVV